MAIGEEKRKWQVKYYTQSGKPDLKIKIPDISRKNKNSEKLQMGAKIADIFAKFKNTNLYTDNNNGSTTTSSNGMNTSESDELQTRIDNHIETVNLQSFQNQVDMYTELLKPISNVLEKTVLAQPTSLGFGDDGMKFTQSIQNIKDFSYPTSSSSSSSSTNMNKSSYNNNHNNQLNEDVYSIEDKNPMALVLKNTGDNSGNDLMLRSNSGGHSSILPSKKQLKPLVGQGRRSSITKLDMSSFNLDNYDNENDSNYMDTNDSLIQAQLGKQGSGSVTSALTSES